MSGMNLCQQGQKPGIHKELSHDVTCADALNSYQMQIASVMFCHIQTIWGFRMNTKHKNCHQIVTIMNE